MATKSKLTDKELKEVWRDLAKCDQARVERGHAAGERMAKARKR